jgi:hypothetical protein
MNSECLGLAIIVLSHSATFKKFFVVRDVVYYIVLKGKTFLKGEL